jgi:hypothetical protein
MRLSVTNERADSVGRQAGRRRKNNTERPCKSVLRAAAIYDFRIVIITRVESKFPKLRRTEQLTVTNTLQKRATLFSLILPLCSEDSQATPACPLDNSSIKVERYWQRKPKCSEKNLSQCDLVQHKSHFDWPWMEPAHPRWATASWSPELRFG